MIKSAIGTIAKNVRVLRKSLGVSRLDFAILTSLSKATIDNIEAGKTGYNIKLLDNICGFTKYKVTDLTDEKLTVSFEIRDKLIKEYKGDIQFTKILTSKPKIAYSIKSKLINSDFLDLPKEVNDIRLFFKNIGWDYKGTSISNELKRMSELIEIKKHPIKKNTNIYLKK